MARLDKFPYIKEVALSMAYSNDMINRQEPEHLFVDGQDSVLASVDEDDLLQLDAWIGTLSREQRETLADGEETEVKELAAAGPQGPEGPVSNIFNDMFENY